MALTISHSPKQHTPRELCVHLWRKENNIKKGELCELGSGGITVCSGLSLGTQASQPSSQPSSLPASRHPTAGSPRKRILIITQIQSLDAERTSGPVHEDAVTTAP